MDPVVERPPSLIRPPRCTPVCPWSRDRVQCALFGPWPTMEAIAQAQRPDRTSVAGSWPGPGHSLLEPAHAFS